MLTELERAVQQAAAQRDRRVAGLDEVRRKDGIVHTPPELARFAVRSADRTLRAHLDREDGLTDARVAVVDPACGPGAFLAAVLCEARGPGRPGPAVLLGLDRDREALDAARALLVPAARHRTVALSLRQVDTLASLAPWPAPLPAGASVVVVGNPPWRVGSEDGSPPLLEPLLDDFCRDHDGRRLAERRIGVLRDAYVRFWRWSVELVRRAEGGGVVVLVTNASFLEGPVHRGMRRAIAAWFDGVDVLDLGGSSLIARSGRRDDNVFGVRPSVALTLAWRKARRSAADGVVPATVRYVRLWGTRGDKLARLAEAEPGSLGWKATAAVEPAWLFVPSAQVRWPHDSVSLAEAMPFHREGLQTNRDRVAVDADRHRLLERLRAFVRGERRADLAPAFDPLRHYDPERAREAVRRALDLDPTGLRGVAVRRLAYRPFDERWVVAVAPLCHRPRPDLLRAVDRSEWVLLSVRKDRGERPWAHFGAARAVPDNCWLSTRSSCRTRAFPTHRPDGRPNLAPETAGRLAERIGARPTSAGFARYALGVLGSRAYRLAYDGVLRLDYPRIPLPRDARAFDRMVAAGGALYEAFTGLEPTGGERGGELVVGHARIHAPLALVHALEAAEQAYLEMLRS